MAEPTYRTLEILAKLLVLATGPGSLMSASRMCPSGAAR